MTTNRGLLSYPVVTVLDAVSPSSCSSSARPIVIAVIALRRG